jgi:hypothetical protein
MSCNHTISPPSLDLGGPSQPDQITMNHGCPPPVRRSPSAGETLSTAKNPPRCAPRLAHLRGQSCPDRPLALHDSRDLEIRVQDLLYRAINSEELFVRQLTSEASSPPTPLCRRRYFGQGAVESSMDSKSVLPLRMAWPEGNVCLFILPAAECSTRAATFSRARGSFHHRAPEVCGGGGT